MCLSDPCWTVVRFLWEPGCPEAPCSKLALRWVPFVTETHATGALSCPLAITGWYAQPDKSFPDHGYRVRKLSVALPGVSQTGN